MGGGRISDSDERAALESRIHEFLKQQMELLGEAVGNGGASSSNPPPAPPDSLQLVLPMTALPPKEGCTVIAASPMASPAASHHRSSIMQGQSSTPSRSTAAASRGGALNPAATPTSRQPGFGPPTGVTRTPSSSGFAPAPVGAVGLGTPSSSAMIHEEEGTAAKRRRLVTGGQALMEPSPFQLPVDTRSTLASPASGTTSVISGASRGGGAGAAGEAAQRCLGGGSLAPSLSLGRQASGGSFSTASANPTGLPPYGAGASTPSSARRNPLLSRLMSVDALAVSFQA